MVSSERHDRSQWTENPLIPLPFRLAKSVVAENILFFDACACLRCPGSIVVLTRKQFNYFFIIEVNLSFNRLILFNLMKILKLTRFACATAVHLLHTFGVVFTINARFCPRYHHPPLSRSALTHSEAPMFANPRSCPVSAVMLLLTMLMLASCGKQAAPPPPALPEVGVLILASQSVATNMELPGRVSAVRMAQIRPQVGGIIKKRIFTEGAEVAAGAPLYQIDPAPFQAALARARGELARADAQMKNARVREERLQRLLKSKMVSQQDYDAAEADLMTARADVEVAQAAVQTATIDLGYTNITAPISGRIGKSIVTEGALVEAEQEEPLAIIQQLDPIYVDLTQSSNALMRLRRQLAAGELRQTATGQGVVHLILDDGSKYAHPGTLEFSEVTVEESTGSVTLRATFPNTDRSLLPGMFVRAQLEEGVRDNVILAPQLAITRNHSGQAVALVVNAEDKVEQRVLTTDRAIGDQWLVTDGLKAGERIVVEGLQKARPGAQVKPVSSNLGAVNVPTTDDAKAH